MELKEFVSQSLLQIFEGISEAQRDVVEKHKGFINPVNKQGVPNEYNFMLPAVLSQERIIHFDVAIRVSEKDNAQAGLTVFSGILGGGAKAGIEFHDATTSRIQFEIPVQFPGQLINR